MSNHIFSSSSGEKMEMYLCYSDVYVSTTGKIGGEGIAWVITAKSKEQIKEKYPCMIVVEPGEVLEQILKLPLPPGDQLEMYRKRLKDVHPANRINIDSAPVNASAIAYVQGKKMDSFFLRYRDNAGNTKHIKIFAANLTEILSKFTNLEQVLQPIGEIDRKDSYLTSPIYCIDHVAAIAEEMSR